MMKYGFNLLLLAGLLVLFGCKTVENIPVQSREEMGKEGDVVFTRAAQYAIFFGNYSQRDYIQVTYLKLSKNAAGQPVLQAGIRYSGPASWTNWFREAPERMSISAKTIFYRTPGDRGVSAPVYSSVRRRLPLRRGETYQYEVVCPVKNAGGFQLVLGEDGE